MPINDTRGLWRGKRIDNGEWVKGDLVCDKYFDGSMGYFIFERDFDNSKSYTIDSSTLGECTGLRDKNGKLIFEGDIVQYNAFYYFSCKSVVKISNYKQDGSDGEYEPTECYGMFVEVDSFACPDWGENEFNLFPEYLMQQNLLEVASECEIIGNIHDNPNLLKGAEINGSRS